MIPISQPFSKFEKRGDELWFVQRNCFGDIIFQWRFR